MRSDFPTKVRITTAPDASGVLDGKAGIEQHADADEEKEAKEIADGDDVAEGLVAELRFAEDQAGDECAEREGEAAEPGRVSNTDSDSDDGDEK